MFVLPPRPRHLFRLPCGSRPKPRWCSPAHCLNVRSVVVQEVVEALSFSAMSMNVMWKKKVVENCILVWGNAPDVTHGVSPSRSGAWMRRSVNTMSIIVTWKKKAVGISILVRGIAPDATHGVSPLRSGAWM